MINLRHYICHEYLNTHILLCTSFIIFHVILTGHFPCVMLANLTIFLAVNLVSYEDLGYILISMLENAVQPHLDILKRVCVCHVEAENHALRLLVETQGQGAEPLLSRSIPNLTLHRLIIRSAVRR